MEDRDNQSRLVCQPNSNLLLSSDGLQAPLLTTDGFRNVMLSPDWGLPTASYEVFGGIDQSPTQPQNATEAEHLTNDQNDIFQSSGPVDLGLANSLVNLSGSSGSVIPHEPISPNDTLLGSELQQLESSQFTFPDDASLPIPALSVMRASLLIAQKLNCADSVWDMTFRRCFTPSNDTCIAMLLPRNMWPTAAQKSIQHHPLFDILPWPSVRERLIYACEMLPLQQRPPPARDPGAIANIVYDIDDPAEGFRLVSGGSSETEFDPENWEIGQAFYRNWWWALDRAIVARSNALRRARGLPPLKVGWG